MKRIITLLFLLVNLSYSMAGPIDSEIAKKVANNFMNSRRPSSKILNIVSEHYNNEISFYVINFVGGGWVMVSSDDRTVPILGFGLEGGYRLEDFKPSGFVALTDLYKKQIQNSRKLNQKNSDLTKKWDNLLKNSFADSKSSKGLVGGLLNVPAVVRFDGLRASTIVAVVLPHITLFPPVAQVQAVIVIEKMLVAERWQWDK